MVLTTRVAACSITVWGVYKGGACVRQHETPWPSRLSEGDAPTEPTASCQLLGNYRDYRGYIGIIGYILGFIQGNIDFMGIMEKRMETTVIYWGYIGIMEKRMETTIMGYIGVLSWYSLRTSNRPQHDIGHYSEGLLHCRI